MSAEYFKIYIEYIKNTGGSPLITWFDEDWEPIGPMVRKKLEEVNAIQYKDGKIILVED